MPPSRLAQNRLIFREVNVRVGELSLQQVIVPWTERTEYFCECGRPDCVDSVELTLAEFEAVRSDESTFVIAPTHNSPAAAIVEQTDRYVIVERGDSGPEEEE
jgi:hypothetical protein